MTNIAELISGEKAWLTAIPDWQATTIEDLLQDYPPEDAAAVWIVTHGGGGLPAFESESDASGFVHQFLDELTDFLCGSDRYNADRERLTGELKPTQSYIIATISAGLGHTLGASAVVLAPVVALFLITISRVGLSAWCHSRRVSE